MKTKHRNRKYFAIKWAEKQFNDSNWKELSEESFKLDIQGIPYGIKFPEMEIVEHPKYKI